VPKVREPGAQAERSSSVVGEPPSTTGGLSLYDCERYVRARVGESLLARPYEDCVSRGFLPVRALMVPSYPDATFDRSCACGGY
jgi:hypothetical protein